MSRSLQILAVSLALLAPVCAHAQGAAPIEGVRPPLGTVELFTGYSNMQANTVITGARLNLNGVTSSIAFYWRDRYGWVGDAGVYRQNSIAGSGLSLGVSTYQTGPRVRFHYNSRLTTFAELLVGVGHAGGTLYTRPLGPGLAPLRANTTALETVGGGVDLKLTPRIAIRLVQAEYMHSNFVNGYGKTQDSFRFSAGINFYFGYYY